MREDNEAIFSLFWVLILIGIGFWLLHIRHTPTVEMRDCISACGDAGVHAFTLDREHYVCTCEDGRQQ